MSKATKKWDISNATWIRQPNGKPLIVHFEVALDTFHQYLATSSSKRHVAVVDRKTGRIVLQDNVPCRPRVQETGGRRSRQRPR